MELSHIKTLGEEQVGNAVQVGGDVRLLAPLASLGADLVEDLGRDGVQRVAAQALGEGVCARIRGAGSRTVAQKIAGRPRLKIMLKVHPSAICLK